jgi:hypothetical protein
MKLGLVFSGETEFMPWDRRPENQRFRRPKKRSGLLRLMG